MQHLCKCTHKTKGHSSLAVWGTSVSICSAYTAYHQISCTTSWVTAVNRKTMVRRIFVGTQLFSSFLVSVVTQTQTLVHNEQRFSFVCFFSIFLFTFYFWKHFLSRAHHERTFFANCVDESENWSCILHVSVRHHSEVMGAEATGR